MRNKLIFISLTLCLAIIFSACGKKPIGEVDNNAVASAASTSEVKEEKPKEEIKVEEPKKEEPKKEIKQEEKEEIKQEVQKPAATNNTTASNSKPVEHPKTVASTVTTSTNTTQPIAPAQPSVPLQDIPAYKEFHTLMQNAVPCNGNYKVTFDKNQGQAPNLVNYTIVIPNYKKGAYYNKKRNYVVYNGNVVSTDDWGTTSDKVANGSAIIESKMGIPAYSDMPKQLDCYVIIVGNDNITYYEKTTYTVTQINR